MHYLNQFNYHGYVSGTTRLKLNQKKLNNIPISLPPVNEQKRVANKATRLLDKVDQAKQLIDEAKETFELRRAAILDKAFRGALTEAWRQEHSSKGSSNVLFETIKNDPNQKKVSKEAETLNQPFELPKGWTWIRIRDIATIKSGYAFKSKEFVKDGYQLVRMGNLYRNNLDLSRNPVYLPYEYDENILNKYRLNEGDILLSLTGTKYKRDYGYAVRIKNVQRPLLLNQRILSLTPLELNDYFYYYLQSSTFRDMFFSFETGGVNQGNVGSRAVEGIYFPLPPYEEGIEIQRKLVQIIETERKAYEVVLNLQSKIDKIKQSILSKAFRGELGTNDPTEESAMELLKEVFTEDQVNN